MIPSHPANIVKMCETPYFGSSKPKAIKFHPSKASCVDGTLRPYPPSCPRGIIQTAQISRHTRDHDRFLQKREEPASEALKSLTAGYSREIFPREVDSTTTAPSTSASLPPTAKDPAEMAGRHLATPSSSSCVLLLIGGTLGLYFL